MTTVLGSALKDFEVYGWNPYRIKKASNMPRLLPWALQTRSLELLPDNVTSRHTCYCI